MRDAEFRAAALVLLTEICRNVARVADACERAERWTTGADVPPANAAAVLLGEDDETPPCPALPPENPTPRRKRGRRG